MLCQASTSSVVKAHQVKMYDFFGVQVLHALQQSGAMMAPAGKQTLVHWISRRTC